MEDILKKISGYQIFNFLLCGAILTLLLQKTTNINLTSPDSLTTFFTYYFIGLILSRLGSLLVEPALRRLKIIVFVPYNEYLKALGKDPKIDTLSQENNTYRTLIATFLSFVAIYILQKRVHGLTPRQTAVVTVAGSVLLVILFVLSYRKQTTYITKKVNQLNKK